MHRPSETLQVLSASLQRLWVSSIILVSNRVPSRTQMASMPPVGSLLLRWISCEPSCSSSLPRNASRNGAPV